jgi:hypothetical protein
MNQDIIIYSWLKFHAVIYETRCLKFSVPARCSVTYKLKVEAGGHDIIQWELSPFHNKETTCISNNYSMQEMRLKGDNFYNNVSIQWLNCKFDDSTLSVTCTIWRCRTKHCCYCGWEDYQPSESWVCGLVRSSQRLQNRDINCFSHKHSALRSKGREWPIGSSVDWVVSRVIDGRLEASSIRSWAI